MSTMTVGKQESLLTKHCLAVEDFPKLGVAGILDEDSRVDLIKPPNWVTDSLSAVRRALEE